MSVRISEHTVVLIGVVPNWALEILLSVDEQVRGQVVAVSQVDTVDRSIS